MPSHIDPPPPPPDSTVVREEPPYPSPDPLGEFGSEPAADHTSERRTRTFNFDVPAANERRKGTGASASQQITTLERRIAELTTKDRLLQETAALVAGLEHRASEARAALERQLSRAEEQLGALDASIAESQRRMAAALAELDARVIHLTGSGGEIERADRSVGALEQRVSDMRTEIEQRVETLVAERARLEQSAAALEERASYAASDLERRLGQVSARQREVDAAAQEAARTATTLADLESRLATMKADRDAVAATTAQTGEEVERLAARLEQQSVSTDAELDRANRARADLAREIARLEAALARTTKAARTETRRLAQAYRRNRRAQMAAGAPDGTSVAARVRSWIHPLAQLPARRRSTIAAVAAIVLAVLLVVPWIGRTAPTASLKVVEQGAPLAGRPPQDLGSAPQIEQLATSGQAAVPPEASPVAEPAPPPRVTAPPSVTAPPPRRPLPAATARAATAATAGERLRLSEESDAGAPGVFVGDLSIASTPSGARVFVDQRAVGVTPVVLTGLPVGSHVVRIEREGYARWSGAVSVSSVRSAQVTAQLDRAR